ncbi:hypothetical protein TL16_g03915 [Triparma laevis f. inornata]|uniref:Uncharacterized protein n=1 Tax=Triparma laevis f. inornata TaxID=1714386 RepID=A0A9W7E6D6_9STRA|nr:hypothetical protein TL16_g03915 [Triparma laevis f. inornata]
MSTAKGLNKTTSQNTHRFTSQKKASSSLTLDPYSKSSRLSHSLKNDYNGEVTEDVIVKEWTKTRQALELQKELNPVDTIKEFCWKLSKSTLTLPILLHNVPTTTEYILELLNRDSKVLETSYSSIFTVLAHWLEEAAPLPDLKLCDFLTVLTDIITGSVVSKDLKILEIGLNALSSLIKSHSLQIQKSSCKLLRQIYSPILGSKIEYIRRLGSQSISVGLRKVSDKLWKKHWSLILNILSQNPLENINLTDGLGMLLAECLKGGKGSLIKSGGQRFEAFLTVAYGFEGVNIINFLKTSLLLLGRHLKASDAYYAMIVKTCLKVECGNGVKIVCVKRVLGFNPSQSCRMLMEGEEEVELRELLEQEGNEVDKVSLICLLLKYIDDESLVSIVTKNITGECDLNEIVDTVLEKIIKVAKDDWEILGRCYNLYKNTLDPEEEGVWEKRVFDEKLDSSKRNLATSIYKHFHKPDKKSNKKIKKIITESDDPMRVGFLIDLIVDTEVAEAIFNPMLTKWFNNSNVLTYLSKITETHPDPTSLSPLNLYSLLHHNLKTLSLRPPTLTLLSNLTNLPILTRLKTLIPIENNPTIQNYRAINSHTESVQSHISSYPKNPETPILVDWLVGVLSVRFKEVWKMAVGALTELLGIESVRSIVWTVVWNSISQKMRREGSEGTDEVTVQSMLFEVLEGAPTAVVKYHNIFVPSFFNFLTKNYYPIHNNDTDFHEIQFPKEYTLLPSTTSTITNNITNNNIQPIKESTETLTSYLKVFSSINGPNQMSSHLTLHAIHLTLLNHPSPKISTLAMKSILQYKSVSLKPYSKFLIELTSSENFRETLTTFTLEEVPGEHRPELTKILTRVLFGKLNSKSGKGKRSKDTPKTRRAAVLSFLGNFTEDECEEIMFLIFKGFVDGGFDVEGGLTRFKERVVESEIEKVEKNKMVGFLNMVGGVMGKLGFKVRGWVEVMAGLMMRMLEYSEVEGGRIEDDVEEEDEEGEEEQELGRKFSKDKKSSIRSLTIKRLSDFFALYSTLIPMEQYGERLFAALATSIKKLPKTVISVESKTSAPALLQLLETLSSSVPLLEIFSTQNAMPTIIECLNPSTSPQSLDCTLKIISNCLTMKPDIIKSHLTEIVEGMSELVGETTRRNGKLETKQLTILCDICEILGDNVEGVSPNTLLTLVTILLPFLDQSNKSSSRDEYQQLNVLGIVSSFLPSIPPSSRKTTIPMLSKLLGPIKSKQGVTNFGVRSGIVECSTKAVGPENQASLDLLDLNSRSSKYVEEHDFNKVLPILNKLGSPSGWRSYDDDREALPLLFTVLHYIYDSDGVLSRGASKAVKAFITFSGETKSEIWLRVLETSVLPVMKNGIMSKIDSTRKSFILAFRSLASTFGSKGSHPNSNPLLFGDLESLIKEDDEVDFFFNITHVQVHRRARALQKLRKELEGMNEDERKVRFGGPSLSNFLAPVCTHPIFEASKSTDEAAALEGGATLGAVAKYMKWGAYSATLGLFFTQIPRHQEVERYLVAAMCKVLDNFNFDLGESGSVAMNGIEKLMERIEKLLYVEAKDKAGSRTKTMRAAVALALLKLYQKLPTAAFEYKFENLVLSVCRELKSKESNSRDIARATLGRMSVAAGLENFGVVLKNLEVTLGEGYQLHVRSAALHTCVLALSQNDDIRKAANSGSGGLDVWVPDIMNLVLADIFGVAAEMKESKDVGKRIIKEAVGVRSYDTLEILSGIIRFKPEEENSAVLAVTKPLIEKLSEDDSKINLAVIKKVREALNKVVIGFSKNEDAQSEAVLKFVLATIRDVLGDGEGSKCKRKRGEREEDEEEDDADLEESDSDEEEEEKGPIKITSKGGKLKESKGGKKAKKSKGSVETWQPSMHTVHNKKSARDAAKAASKAESMALDGAQAPKLTGTGRHGKSRMADGKGLNDPAVSCGVVFGLKFLHACLKKGKIDWNSSVVKERAAPFVTILTSGSLRILTKGGIGGSKDEVVQGIFKVLTFLFKMKGEEKGSVLNEKQMRALVGLLRSTVADTSHHNSTFGLIAAIVGMRVVNLEVYELMDDVLDLVVQSTNPSVRSLGASTFTSFILNYELGEKKVESLLTRIVGNCKYEFDDGRASGLEMLNKVLSNLKPKTLNANADKFFLPLVLQLHNDGSSLCKEKCGDVLGSLVKRVDEEKMKSFFGIIKAWGEKEETRVVALKVLGIICDARVKWVKGGRRAEVEKIFVGAIEGDMEVGEAGKGARFGEDWERVYFALVGLEKFGSGVVGAEVVSCLTHYHPWCKLVAGRIVVGGLVGNGLKGVKAGYYELVKGFGGQIDVDAKFTNDSVAMGAIKGVVLVVKLMKGGDLEEAERAKKWLFNRLAGAAKKSSGGVRINIFKTFAGLLGVCDVSQYLSLILGPLHRAISEADAVNNETEENVDFMKELLGLIEDKVGTDVFMKAYADVRTKAKERRDARKSEIAIEKVVDPMAAAQRKERKKEAEIGRKKRRFEEKKCGRGRGGRGGGEEGGEEE